MLTNDQINVLGNIFETSWGKSSHDYSCTAKLEGNLLRVQYSTIVYLASEKSTQSQIPLVSQEASERIKGRIDSAKKEYKEVLGETLSLKEVTNDEDVQYIQASYNSPRKVVLFRKHVDLQIG